MFGGKVFGTGGVGERETECREASVAYTCIDVRWLVIAFRGAL